MNELKFIGTTGQEYVNQTFGTLSWQFKEFPFIPLPPVNYPNGWFLTTVSGCASVGTVSYGLHYNAAMDLFRCDPSTGLVDVDHYIAGSLSNASWGIFKTPPTNYHHLKTTDPLFSNLSRPWQYTIRQILSRNNEP